MKLFSSSSAIFWIVGICLWNYWQLDNRIGLSNEISTYELLCEEPSEDGGCKIDIATDVVLTYKVFAPQQTVIVWSEPHKSNRSPSAPSTLQRCSVRDVRNWECLGAPQANPDTEVKTSFVDGKFIDRDSDEVGRIWRYVPAWRWWLVRFREHIS